MTKITSTFLLVLFFASGIILYCSVAREMGLDYLLKVPNEITTQTNLYGNILLTISAVLFASVFFLTRTKNGIGKKIALIGLSAFYVFETFNIVTAITLGLNSLLLIIGTVAISYVTYISFKKR